MIVFQKLSKIEQIFILTFLMDFMSSVNSTEVSHMFGYTLYLSYLCVFLTFVYAQSLCHVDHMTRSS